MAINSTSARYCCRSILLTVIIPVFNAATTLRRCLDSILAEHNVGLEIICVNDGSTDDSSKILDEYRNLYGIKVIEKPNSGVSPTRNMGIEIAEGEYIMFVDADDEVCNLHEFIENIHGEDIVISSTLSVINNEGENIQRLLEPVKSCYTTEILSIFSRNINTTLFRAPWGKVFKKSILEGVLFDENIRWGEDVIFNMQTARRCKSIAIVDVLLYKYYKPTDEYSKYQISVECAVEYLDIHYKAYISSGLKNREYERVTFELLRGMCDKDMKSNFKYWFEDTRTVEYWNRIKDMYPVKSRIKYKLRPFIYSIKKHLRKQ